MRIRIDLEIFSNVRKSNDAIVFLRLRVLPVLASALHFLFKAFEAADEGIVLILMLF